MLDSLFKGDNSIFLILIILLLFGGGLGSGFGGIGGIFDNDIILIILVIFLLGGFGDDHGRC